MKCHDTLAPGVIQKSLRWWLHIQVEAQLEPSLKLKLKNGNGL